MSHARPPLGATPRYIVDAHRKDELKGAIQRMIDADYRVALEWIEEYNEIVEREKRRMKAATSN